MDSTMGSFFNAVGLVDEFDEGGLSLIFTVKPSRRNSQVSGRYGRT